MLHQLPPDALHRILWWSHQPEEFRMPPVYELRRAGPLRVAHALSQVCRSLRTFVFQHYLATGLSAVNFQMANTSKFVTPRTMQVLGYCCKMTSFSATYLVVEGDEMLAPLLQLQGLRELRIPGISGISERFLRGCTLPNLKVLDISHVSIGVGSATMQDIAKLPSVSILLLCGCDGVCDEGVNELATGPIASSLECIGLQYCPVSNTSLERLLECATNLRQIYLAEPGCNLWATGNYTHSGIQQLEVQFPAVSFVFTV